MLTLNNLEKKQQKNTKTTWMKFWLASCNQVSMLCHSAWCNVQYMFAVYVAYWPEADSIQWNYSCWNLCFDLSKSYLDLRSLREESRAFYPGLRLSKTSAKTVETSAKRCIFPVFVKIKDNQQICRVCKTKQLGLRHEVTWRGCVAIVEETISLFVRCKFNF